MGMRLASPAYVLALLSATLFSACGDDVEVGENGATTGGSGGAAGDGSAGMGASPTMQFTCQGKIYECGDLLDNDNDGLVDAQDPDCLGPCDNTEDSYYGGIPGQAGPVCLVDCYFDQDSGAGNDQCYWNHRCDPLAVAPSYPPEGKNQAGNPVCEYDSNASTPGTSASCDELLQDQLEACRNFCAPLTPNGCDCFGCCELPAGSGSFVWLGSEDAEGNGSCSLGVVDDPEKCQPCTPVPGCFNGCGECELCIGKEKLPDKCLQKDAGLPEQCPAGVQPCGRPGQAACADSKYCVTGCCITVPT